MEREISLSEKLKGGTLASCGLIMTIIVDICRSRETSRTADPMIAVILFVIDLIALSERIESEMVSVINGRNNHTAIRVIVNIMQSDMGEVVRVIGKDHPKEDDVVRAVELDRHKVRVNIINAVEAGAGREEVEVIDTTLQEKESALVPTGAVIGPADTTIFTANLEM